MTRFLLTRALLVALAMTVGAGIGRHLRVRCEGRRGVTTVEYYQ